MLEAQDLRSFNPYTLLADFFDPLLCGRWQNADDRAHKTFVVLAWLERCSGAPRSAPTGARPDPIRAL